jgi:hypothetical protein
MLENISKFWENLKNSEIFTKKFSRRDFLKGVGMVFAFLSLSSVTKTLPTPPTPTNKSGNQGPSGYGATGYGV